MKTAEKLYLWKPMEGHKILLVGQDHFLELRRPFSSCPFFVFWCTVVDSGGVPLTSLFIC